MTRLRISARRWAAVALAMLAAGGAGSAWAAFSSTTSNGANSFSSAPADTAAPTVSRAVAAKTSGATPGTIRQGGDYYVYAQVTDDSSGVSTVTTSTSSFDSGVTSASLSSSGGPWTVGGQTYNYRSAVLTANTPLNTGSSFSYSITATDVAGNSTSPSYSVTIETYADVISATAGIVSHWRLGDGAIVGDELDDSAGTVLTSHTGALGASWTAYAGEARTAVFTNENRLRKETGTGAAMYYASGAPSSADYLVEADVHVKSLLATDAVGVAGRIDTGSSSGTYYLARYLVDSGQWQLLRVSSGSATSLGTYAQTLTAGQTYRVELRMSGTSITVYVDGVLRITAGAHTAITAAGRGGLRFGTGGSTAQPANTTGLHLDDIRVSSLTTTASDSVGTNNGTYTGGVGLNALDPLVGDANRATIFDGSNDYISVPDAASLDLGNGPLTLEAWIKRGSTADSSILEKSLAYELHVVANRLALRKPGTADIVQSTTTISDTTSWHHVVATKNGTTSKLYIDGVDVTGTVTDQTLVNTANALEISGSPRWNGQLDEVAIYNQALSASAVQDHYDAGKGTG